MIAIAGKDKGKQGEVVAILKDNRCLVSGINMVKKHKKPNPQRSIEGGIVDQEASIHQSNIAIYNPESGKPDRVGFKFVDDEKVRIYKSTQNPIDEG